MKIVYIHQYYLTQEQGGAIRSYYISQALKAKGHDIHIITSHNKLYNETRIIEGTTVYYLPVGYDNSYGFIKRMIAFLSFIFKAYSTAKKIKGVDLVFATSTPLTVGLIALWLRKFQKLPYVFEVRDLWPEAPIQLGYLNNPVLRFLARRLEKSIYNNASSIIALSPSMEEGIKKVSATPTLMIPNMSDCDFFIPASSPPLPVTIVYFGALGKVNRVESLIELAAYAQTYFQGDYKFIIAGQGSEIEKLKQLAKPLNNIEFRGSLNKEAVKKLLAHAHVTYTSFGPQPILETNSPNKFFDSIAMGKVCVITTKGWICDLIQKHEIGFYYSANNPAAFFRKLVTLAPSMQSYDEIAKRSRALAKTQFNKNKLVAQVISALESAVSKPRL
ncbi:MAG: glycosyltransferase family 4 protein [Cytophagaceae bacterium]|nr:glycosyltransferase family 4 protein [Cytophagaceae bacterium]